MWPHGGTVVPATPLEQVEDFINGLDPMTMLLAGIATILIFMLYVALTTEEER